MSESESSTEETVNAIIEQCHDKALQVKSRKTAKKKLRQKRREMSAQELELLRKNDNERKRKRRREMSEEERKLCLKRENERARLRRLASDNIDQIRAKEAEIKRKRRQNMPLDKLKEFRARDAERKRLERQKIRMSLKAQSSPKPHSKKQSKVKNSLCDNEEGKTTESRRGRLRKVIDSDEADIQISSEEDTVESYEYGQTIDCYETDDRVKELEAVLNDLLEDGAQEAENIRSKKQKEGFENSLEDRAAQLEEQIWQLIDERENMKQQTNEITVKNDEEVTITESSEEFTQLEERILQIIHNHYEELEDLIGELKS